MIKLVTIIGARPQFIKAAAISRAIANHFAEKVSEVIVHTGQHYDPEMSQVFFDELKIPRPQYRLETGSGSHGEQTAAMISGIEKILLKEKPHAVVLYGDTNSTLAGAIAASKLYLKIAHVEAGLRSFNKRMPEEINRILCDHVSTFLFCPTETAARNLIMEGFSGTLPDFPDPDHPAMYQCGDVMYDNTLFFAAYAGKLSGILSRLGLNRGGFILATIHRDLNTDYPERLASILRALLSITEKSGQQILLPLHPRTRKMLDEHPDKELLGRVKSEKRMLLVPPVSFLEMTSLEEACAMVVTDSGGVQKEAYFLKKPCIVLREETEWVELIESGSAILTDADEGRIARAYEKLSSSTELQFPEIFGNGNAAEWIVKILTDKIGK